MVTPIMMKHMPTPRRTRRLNARQRKKRRLGEFRELVFEIRIAFRQPMDDDAYDAWLDAMIGMIEARGLCFGGMGGSLPMRETGGVIQKWGRGSPSEDDRQAVLQWLRDRPEVAHSEAGELADGWYD